MRALPLLLAALVLAGCLAPAASEPRAVRAGNSTAILCDRVAGARWMQPGLYERALAVRPGGLDAPRVERSMPVSGLGYHDPDVEARWGPAPLAIVAHGEGRHRAALMSFHGEAPILVLTATDPDAASEAARVLLEGLGLGGSPQAEAVERAIRDGGLSRTNALPWPGALPDLSRARGLLGGSPREDFVGDRLSVWGNGWSLDFSLPHARIHDEHAGAPLEVRIYPTGSVEATTTLRGREPEWPTVSARLNATFARLGLPAPSLEDAMGGSSPRC